MEHSSICQPCDLTFFSAAADSDTQSSVKTCIEHIVQAPKALGTVSRWETTSLAHVSMLAFSLIVIYHKNYDFNG